MDTSDSTTLKRCSKCGEEKPRDQFRPDKQSRDGLYFRCRTCSADVRRQYYLDNREKVTERQRRYNAANRDAVNERNRERYAENRDSRQQYAREYYAEHSDERRAYAHQYRAENKDSVRQSQRQYYTKNRESLLERNRLYYAENREELREYQRRYRAENRDLVRQKKHRYYAANKETIKGYIRRWLDRNPDMVRAQRHRRLARKRSLPDVFTASDWQFALDYFGGCCAVCARPPGLWHTLAADHWIPLASPDCPGTVPRNIVPLCHGEGGCNNAKQSRTAAEWLTATFGKRKGTAILRRIEAFLLTRL